MSSLQKFDLEREEYVEDDINEDLRDSNTQGSSSHPSIIIKKKGWFNLRKNSRVSPQFVVLTEKEIIGLETENIELNEHTPSLTSIPLDIVSNVVVKEGGISIQDKGGNYYHLQGPEAEAWSKLISSLLPS